LNATISNAREIIIHNSKYFWYFALRSALGFLRFISALLYKSFLTGEKLIKATCFVKLVSVPYT